MEEVDLLVIGAGWFGLAAAKTYLEVNPNASIAVLTDSATIGGTWAEERLYPGLKTNNMLGTFEFSNFPMDTKIYGVKAGEFIPGEVIHRYLFDYAKNYGFYEKIRFGSKAISAEHQDEGGWIVKVLCTNASSQSVREYRIYASRLIVATGKTTKPFIPNYPSLKPERESTDVPLFHSKDLAKHLHTLETAKNVCVFGSSKSANDMAYAYASRGIHVDWILRESGHGPLWMSKPYVTPFGLRTEKLFMVRFLNWFSPCIWGDNDGFGRIRSWLHGTSMGRSIVDTFWGILGNDIKTGVNWDGHPETAKLKPWTNVFFEGATLGIYNYDKEILDLVRDGTISIHISDVTGMSEDAAHLANGEKIKTDAFVMATGWEHTATLEFLPEDVDLGLPSQSGQAEQEKYIVKADEEIFSRFPRLRDQNVSSNVPVPMDGTPEASSGNLSFYRLYHFMIPPTYAQTRDIAFVGELSIGSTPPIAQAQALWVTAFFAQHITLPSDAAYKAILYNRFGKWRYPVGLGARFPDFVFDSLPYIDMLFRDMGLKIWRKRWWWQEVGQPYGMGDYRDMVGEYIALKGKVKEE